MFEMLKVSLFIIVLLAFGSMSGLHVTAQVQTDQEQPVVNERVKELDKHPTPKAFVDRLSSRMGDEIFLYDFAVISIVESHKLYLLRFWKNANAVTVVLKEFDNPEIATRRSGLHTHISMGAIRSDDRYGEAGRRIYDNGFEALQFRKGRFEFKVDTNDEKLADSLAGLAVETFDRLMAQ